MSNYSNTDVAVIGIAGQFPGAKNIEEFWSNIREGKESISFFSSEDILGEFWTGLENEGEFLSLFSDREVFEEHVRKSLLGAEGYVKAGSFIEEKHFFDSAFFGYTPEEASLMDPQIRLFHQVCWHALEDSGYVGKNMPAKNRAFCWW